MCVLFSTTPTARPALSMFSHQPPVPPHSMTRHPILWFVSRTQGGVFVCVCVSCSVWKQSSSSHALSHAAVPRCNTDPQIMVPLHPYVSLTVAKRSDCLPFSFCNSLLSLHRFSCQFVFVLPGLITVIVFISLFYLVCGCDHFVLKYQENVL